MTTSNRRFFCTGLAAAAAASILPAAVRAAANKGIGEGQGSNYPSIIGDMQTYVTLYEDSLVDLARKYGLGYTEIVSANPGVDPWVPGADKRIILPTAHILPSGPREGVVINLSDQRLYFFHEDGNTVDSAALGIGNAGWDTPKGTTKVVRKKKDPFWYVPKSVLKEDPELPSIVRPGPDNPLGTRAVYLGWPAYLFHGTNKPFGVGRRVSHGCVRLYPEDIERLYPSIMIGMSVRVMDQAMKVARADDQVWLEVHPNQQQADEVERTGRLTPSKPPEFEYVLMKAAGKDVRRIDWEKAKKTAIERRGFPVAILKD
jgi:L,D-transpeptidase ErfK/SrfK